MSSLSVRLEKFLKESNGFDKVLDKVQIISAENGNCTAELKLEEEHLNTIQMLHSGLSAMLLDVITSMALLSHEKYPHVPNVSVNLHVVNVKEAVQDDYIIIEGRTARVGQRMAYLECEIKNKITGDILVTGNQTKYFLYPKSVTRK